MCNCNQVVLIDYNACSAGCMDLHIYIFQRRDVSRRTFEEPTEFEPFCMIQTLIIIAAQVWYAQIVDPSQTAAGSYNLFLDHKLICPVIRSSWERRCASMLIRSSSFTLGEHVRGWFSSQGSHREPIPLLPVEHLWVLRRRIGINTGPHTVILCWPTQRTTMSAVKTRICN